LRRGGIVSQREVQRRLVIETCAQLGVDACARAMERRSIQRKHAAIVRVLFLHGTPAIHRDRFERQLDWLCTQFNVIDFSTFKAVLDGSVELNADRPAALLTFDDGFLNNFTIGAPLLETRGLRGLFFVVPAFSACASDAEARQFYRRRVRDIPGPYFERAMTPAHIRELADRGHTIGNHTYSHALLSETADAEYRREIVDSAAIVTSWTGRTVEAFAWPLVWHGITARAHRLITTHHRYCFTPCHGRVDPRIDSPRLIWRTNIEPHYDAAEIGFQCSALADAAAVLRRRRLARLLAPAPAAGDAPPRDTDETLAAPQHCH
jgi:hypothetical protein